MDLVGLTVRDDRDDLAHSLLSFVDPRIVLTSRQTIMARMPPGRSARRILRSAKPGKLKNIVPKREKAAS